MTHPLQRRAFLGFLGLLGPCALVAPRSVAAQDRSFTAAERARLVQGGLVTRPDSRDGWLGGTSFRVVDCAPRELARILEDVGNFRHVFPATVSARLEARVGQTRIARLVHQQAGLRVSYALRLTTDRAGTMRFELDAARPHDIDGARGFLELRPMGTNRTLVVWAARVRLPRSVTLLFGSTIERWLLEVPSSFQRYVRRSRSLVAGEATPPPG